MEDSSMIMTVFSVAEIIIFTAVAVKVVQYALAFRNYRKLFNSCPGETEFSWVFGNLHKFPGADQKGLDYEKALTCRFPLFHRVWIGPFTARIILHHPDTVRVILKSSEPKPRRTYGCSSSYEMGINWLGEGLLIANGKKWARNRRLLTPAFHFDILKPYVSVFNKATDIMLSKIEKASRAGETFEVFDFMTLCSLDILLRCAFSYDNDCQLKGDKHPYVRAIAEMGDLWIDRLLKPYYYPDFIYEWSSPGRKFQKHCDYVHQVADDIIEKRRKTLVTKKGLLQGQQNTENNQKKKYLDFLDILLEAKDDNGVGLTPLEIRNEVDTFLFEGHDTTTSATSWILYSLAQHSEIQERVWAEVNEVMEGKSDEVLEWGDLQKLEYLSLCIKEGLRIHCPVSFFERRLTKETEISGFRFPEGTLCAVNVFEIHHNPKVWEDPEKFCPERFLPENMTDRDSFSFIPFSAGPRNCIGQNFAMQEIQTLVARIVYRYRLEVDPANLARKKISLVMKAENGMKLFARERNDKSK